MRSSAAAPRTRAGAESGFTMIELVVVMAVIGVLSMIAVVSYTGYRDHAGRVAAEANIRAVLPALEAFRADHGTYAGASLTALHDGYDPGIDDGAASPYVISDLSELGYCVQVRVGDWYAWATGPSRPIDAGQTGYC
jgi:prepilin-type N-terminal cleavage/methylation domain-containing protein